MSKKALRQQLKNAKYCKNGSFKCFLALSDKVGVKIMPSKLNRDENYMYQKRASKFNLGPKCWSRFYITINNVKWYGYFTEVVDAFYDFDGSDAKVDDLIKNLLDKTGFDFEWDSCCRNIGIKDGVLVCIDFDSGDTVCNSISGVMKRSVDANSLRLQSYIR